MNPLASIAGTTTAAPYKSPEPGQRCTNCGRVNHTGGVVPCVCNWGSAPEAMTTSALWAAEEAQTPDVIGDVLRLMRRHE